LGARLRLNCGHGTNIGLTVRPENPSPE